MCPAIRPLLLGLLAAPVLAQQPLPIAISPLVPATTGGITIVDQALARLTSHRRLLVVGAHPDDEDTSLLAYMTTALGGEAAYLSLSRGEGGQNLIGEELGVGLGVVRSGELMAARSIEGTRQYFTRAYDFGYTRSLQETWQRWPRTTLETDAIRIVRRFKPQVVVAVFPGDDRAGHGQHQASGVIAASIFDRAGHPDRFPELTAEGLPPWRPTVLYRRVWWNREEASLEFPLDAIDPLSGKSVLQIAAASRSLHRSQDMGMLQRLGREQGGLIRLAGEPVPKVTGVFGGVDTELASIADLLEQGALRTRLGERLAVVAERAARARQELAPSRLAVTVPALVEIIETLRDLEAEVLAAGRKPAHLVVADLLSEKLEVASVGLLAAAGVALDALAERETVTVGESLPVTLLLWDSGSQEVTVSGVDVDTAAGWQAASVTPTNEASVGTGLQQWSFEVRVPADAPPTLPYYLERPLEGDLYQWDQATPGVRGEPFEVGPATAVFDLAVAGVAVRIEREVVYRSQDQALGEVRRPIRAVPKLEVSIRPRLVLWPTQGGRHRTVEVLLKSNQAVPVSGELRLQGADDWVGPVSRSFSIARPQGQHIVYIELERADAMLPGRVAMTATATLDGGDSHDAAYPVVEYPHIRPRSMRVPASLDLEVFDLEVPRERRLGYVRGASDRVPEILLDLGLSVRELSGAELETGDLSSYDAIVIGSRAYEANPVLSRANSRLLDYVRAGGLVVVQYQQYQYVRGGYSPARLQIARPHGRVTDETAPVRVIRDVHGILSTPNRIGPGDWQGWVQERGLYFASEWDAPFLPILELHDDGQPEQRGALLVAEVGEGLYVYTGLSFFRQLPAGVPGAIRLFINLISLERS